MRGIIFFLGSLLLLFLLVTGIGLFFPSEVTISRAVDIQAEAGTIRSLLSEPSRWKSWFPAAERWPLVTKQGSVVGIRTPSGNPLMVESLTDSTISVSGLQTASIDGNMGFRMIGGQTPGIVTVQWYMNFQFDWYPWERFSSLLLENKFGTVMEQGLRQLQQQAQSVSLMN